MTCRHENADHIKPGEWLDLEGSGVPTNISPCEQFRCIDCGAWLSLGPSNDAPAAVKIEIRAAEISAVRSGSAEEQAGWKAHASGDDVFPTDPNWAGWLAREMHYPDWVLP